VRRERRLHRERQPEVRALADDLAGEAARRDADDRHRHARSR
jgi:hypothetical protein